MRWPSPKTLALVACTAALCLVLLEGLSRLRYEDRQRKDFAVHTTIGYDAELGWSGIPGTVTVDAFGARHEINADGLRDDDWSARLAAVTPGRTRTILLLGDSLTYGLCIPKRDRLGEQLEALYARNGGQAMVFNTGIPGYGPDQELLALRRHMPRVKPDVVAVYFCVNDFADAALPYDHREPYRRCYKPYFDRTGHPALNTPPVPLRFSQQVKNSPPLNALRMKYLVDDLQGLWDDLRYRLAGVSENRRISDASGPAANMDSLMFDPRFEDLYQGNKQRLFSLYAAMRDECRAAGARFVVLYNHEDISPHEQEFHDTLAAMGIETVSTFAYDHALFDLTPFASVRGDGHPNYLQNAVNALALYNALEHASLTLAPAEAAWYPEVPRAIAFGRHDINPSIFGRWHVSETSGRWFDKQAGWLLRGTGSGDGERLSLEFFSARAATFHVAVNGADHTVDVPAPGRYRLNLPLPAADLYAVFLSADAFIGDDISHNGDKRSLSYYLTTAAIVRTGAPLSHPVLDTLP